MKEIAKDLLKIKAVKLSPDKPFTWASGIKSPIYCDNRLTISYPEIRKQIAQGLAAQIKAEFPDVEVIGGVATAGIPHAAWVADELGLPLVYVRSKPKDHGRGKQIEGVLPAHAKTVLIDDLLSTGGSVLKAVKAAQNEGADVIGVGAIFSYQLPAVSANFEQAGLSFTTLTNYSELLEAATEENYIAEDQLETLKKWRKAPEKWNND
ncbi:Orotate phosphoribosyltransferase [Ligilactobacillus aviarius]|uniref:orotate phosphoribosyltransferase n=1 Tax=Ligilactobacillus aviarius TaxID=1606 RepID=UPI0007D8E87D|nr:orotate phosphoribosyltransferase [Ligilactobacillus aviarius]OAQ02192.1 Orotate phosphoribosyltransferase [Ligilactobacillus aviarius]OAQ04319.1 Orotate phosphoribosyltransferase [Ligilactobacillus aviarius]OAS77385.1 Orotate phosphoribosyltransferase [Ligilactobacillus aviarius]PEG71417.1 orotate phosphoribosyltransferase [Ligilactobacillus aviarius]PEG74139.1 orotate phosphoribosyltransferase [Ligilactobacillus aviarius]